MSLHYLENYSRQLIKADICIVGGGIAGLTIADSLRESNLNICLLEAGSKIFDIKNDGIFNAKNIGNKHEGTNKGRFRVFGGTSSRWGGQLLPFKKEIFSKRSYLNIDSWPISRFDLEPFIRQAERILNVNNLPYEDDFLKDKNFNLKFNNSNLQMRYSKWASFKFRNLSKTIGKNCIKDKNISVFLNSTVSYINLFEDGKEVKNLEIRDKYNRKILCRAEIFILTAGTIETIRLMLLSNNIHKKGIGNYNNLLGKKFHDHLNIKAAEVVPKNKNKFLDLIAPYYIKGTKHSLKFESSQSWEKKNKCLNIMAHLTFEEVEDNLLGKIKQCFLGMQSGAKINFLTNIFKSKNHLKDIFQISNLFWMRYIKKRQWCLKNSKIIMNFDSEQFPNLNSEILISDELDKFKIPKVIINWQWSDFEKRTFIKFQNLINEISNDIDDIELIWYENFLNDHSWEDRVKDTYHHMGGTIMSKSSKEGIVDKNLKVHGLKNLYIASPSVFPSGASSNPTLTLMTLCLRLSEKIKKDIKFFT